MSTQESPADAAIAELRALAETLLEKAEPWLRAESGPADPGGCGWCPLCALATALRGERPELTRRLAEHGAGWISAARALLDAHDTACTPRAAAAPETAAPRIQRIAVRDAPSWR